MTQKRVLITGGASGLGAALAKLYSQQGWAVCIADIQREMGVALANELSTQFGNNCIYQPLDVTSEEQWHNLAQEIGKQWQGLDLLINNAGVASSGDIDQLPMKDFQWTLDVNVMGVVKGCHAFTPMLKQSKGAIVNVASMAGLLHMPSMGAYNASKAAVVALSETLYAELDPYGVHVSVLCPAFFQTNLTKTMRSTESGGIKIANRLMEKSKVQADDVALAVFNGVANKSFYILTHARERLFWRVKRIWPALYFKIVKNIGRKFHKKMTEKSA